MAKLTFTLSTGNEVTKTVADDQVEAEIEAFRTHQREYGADFFPVDNGLWVLRTAVISIGPKSDGQAAFPRLTTSSPDAST